MEKQTRNAIITLVISLVFLFTVKSVFAGDIFDTADTENPNSYSWQSPFLN